MFFLSISLLSGKFPPTISMAKEYINSFVQVRNKFKDLTNRSENYLKNELDDKNPPRIQSKDNLNLDDIGFEIKQLRMQLSRIEQQNKEILGSLKNKN